MASVKLSTKAIGSIVKIKENGTPVNFIVLQHGYPASGNGRTLLLREALYNTMAFDSSNNDYASSDIDTWLNGTYLNLIDADIRSQIAAVNIKSSTGNGTYNVRDLSRKVFLLSYTEAGFSGSSYAKVEGTALSYFNSSSKRIAYLNGAATRWWLRSPYTDGTDYAWYVYAYGVSSYNSVTSSRGSRPAFTLPSSLSVSDDGSVVVNQPPTAPTQLNAPSTIKGGQQFTISWSGATDPDGDLLGYYLQRKLDDGAWEQIYQGTATSTTNVIPFGTADSAQFRVQAYDPSGETSSWYSSGTVPVENNTAPSAPASITVPLQVIGGESLTISWAASSDAEGNLAGYKLERKVASGAWTQIYQGANLSYNDSITKGWTDVTYRVKAYDNLGDESGYTTSPTRTVDNNTAPTITCDSSGDLGDKAAGFSITYSVDDVDGDTVTVVEKMDNVQKRSYTATLEAENSFDVTGEYFMKLLNGDHTMTITATDSAGKSSTLTLTFTKTVHTLSITLETPMAVSDPITKMVQNIVRSIPADATFQVLVTNNANDTEPVWEDATQSIISGLNFLFENQTEANGPAFNFKITAARGPNGQGGFISSIGGAFE